MMKDKTKSGCDSSGDKSQTLADPRDLADEVKARVASRSAAADRQGDPLMIHAKPKDRKRMERMRAEITRNSALARLLIKGQITKDMYEAGMELRHLWTAVAPGMSAIDFTKPKVDGGGPHREGGAGVHLGSETRLKQLIVDSGMGVEAAEIVCMVCALDMLPTLCAIEVEQNESARHDGTCTRETLALVRHQLRMGLQLVWNLMKKRPASRKGLQSMQVWLSDHMLATHQQSRPDATEQRRG